MAQEKSSPAEIHAGLRSLVFGRRAPSTEPDGVRAVLMDVALANGMATVVAFWDGTVSLYTSKGEACLDWGLPRAETSRSQIDRICPEVPRILRANNDLSSTERRKNSLLFRRIEPCSDRGS